MAEERKKRNIAFEKEISEITRDDIRIKTIGTVIEKDESTNSIVIEDSKKNLRILLNAQDFKNVKTGQIIRTIGIVVPALEGEGFEIKSEIIQDFSKLNPDLYAKYLKLKNIKK